MGLFRSKPRTDLSADELARQLEGYQERTLFYQSAIRALLYCMKDFSFDLVEINSDRFKDQIDDFIKVLMKGESVGVVQRSFEEQKTRIINFTTVEKRYLDEREHELKNIIDLLRVAVTGILGENKEFTLQLNERNLRMERITQLDDIRKIKETLQTEVSQLQKLVLEKQLKDNKRIENLAEEVTILKDNLEKAKDASMTDSLTGAHNRLAFELHIAKSVERSIVSWNTFSVLMCDIDYFKRINDMHGHQVGDRVLMCFVRECTKFFRKDDFIARYGGEEFVVVLPGVNLSSATKRARDLCKLLAAKQYTTDISKIEEKIKFTVSIGVSEIHKNDTVEALIERADKALYQAKRTGKNRAINEREMKEALRAANSVAM
ncbi:MAG: GGDEF domain-containing protein [Armatimonadota bacterium]